MASSEQACDFTLPKRTVSVTDDEAEVLAVVEDVRKHRHGKVIITVQEGQITGVDDLRTRRKPLRRR